jgi:DNA helicase II / ATP-dependent DNA helicase PcrA
MPKKTQPLTSATAQNQDEATQQIVTCTDRHVEVLASPGSGKTHTLILRLLHLLDHAVLPQQILVLSFSNEAVRELRRRMDLICTAEIASESVHTTSLLSGIRISTCHAFANSLLRKPSALMTDKTQCKLLTTAIKSLRQDMRKQRIWADVSVSTRRRRRAEIMALLDTVSVRRLLVLLDYARAANLSSTDALTEPLFAGVPAGASVVREVSRRYRELKRKNASMDYADMLHDGVQRLRKGKAAAPYTHVLVDEYQDCSAAQTQLLVALAKTAHTSIMVFGDKHQAIYPIFLSCPS